MKKPGGKRFGDKNFSRDKKSGGNFKKRFSGNDEDRPRRRFNDDKGGDKPFRPKSDGDKPYGKKSYGSRDERGGDKPFRKKFDSDKPYGKKSYGSRDERGGDKPFRRKPDGDKPYGKKSYGDRERGGDDKPFRKKFDSDKPYGKKSYGDRERGGDDKPFRKKFDSDKPYGKKSYGDRERGGDDKQFRKKFDSDKPYGKKSYGDRERGGDDKAFRRRFDNDRGGDKPFRRKFDNDKPSERKEGKSYGDNYTGFRKHEEMRRMKEELGDDWQTFDSKEEANEFVDSQKSSSSKGRPRSKKSSDIQPVAFGEDQIRLNRFIANTGLCSRREADDLIVAGAVKVNGKIVTELGTKVGPNDEVHYGDQLLRREKLSYVLLNKPKDYITTTEDPQERKTVMHLVEEAGNERLYPVGRLDRNTTGLMLLTNDGDLAERLMHPKYGVRKIYHVSLDKNLRSEDFDKIMEGVELEDGSIKADEISYVGDGTDKKEVGIVLHSGRNRIVRRVFEHLGYDVIGLDRVSYAGLTKKQLPRGRWRHLTDEEVGMLKMLVGGTKKSGGRVKKRRD